MTDPTNDPQTALDELASAHLDGLTSAEEARQVTTDPALLARVERLRQVREAVRTPDVPVDAARREVAIAAALAAAPGTELTAPVAPVGDVAVARARRSARRRWLPLVGIAAAVGLAALLVPQLDDDGGRNATVASDSRPIDRRLDDREASTEDRGSHDDDGGGDLDGGDGRSREARPRSTQSSHARDPEADPGSPTAGGTGVGSTATEGDPDDSTSDKAPMTTTTTSAPFAASAPLERSLLDLGAFADGDREELVAAARTAADDPGAAESAQPTRERRAEIDRCITPMEAIAEEEGASVLYAAVAEMGKAADQATVVGIAIELEGHRELRVRYLEDCERWFEAPLDEPGADD